MRARLRASPLVFIELMASGSRFRRDRIGPIIRNEPFFFLKCRACLLLYYFYCSYQLAKWIFSDYALLYLFSTTFHSFCLLPPSLSCYLTNPNSSFFILRKPDYSSRRRSFLLVVSSCMTISYPNHFCWLSPCIPSVQVPSFSNFFFLSLPICSRVYLL